MIGEKRGLNDKVKVICFGIGKIYKAFLEVYDDSKIDIIALSDNKYKEAGKYNLKFVKPQKIKEIEYDYIVVTCAYFTEIKHQLLECGIEEHYILNFYSIYKDLEVQDMCLIGMLKVNMPIIAKYEKGIKEVKKIEEKNLFLNAKIFTNAVCSKKLISLEQVEFQVYSQFGEDGIIQWLIHNVDIDKKIFVEFGVEDYSEANTRFLLMNNNWSGLVIDSNAANMERLRNWECMWKYDLSVVTDFITKDNINSIITNAGFVGDIGILSIDLDGNDYWILEAINCVSPRILICEYNNIYGSEKKVTVPYDPIFIRTEKHYSNLYWGASISAYQGWAIRNGYYYMGSNLAGNNAFFVRQDCIQVDRIPRDANLFVESKYRESRNKKGELNYLSGDERLKCIKEMPLYDLETGCINSIEKIYWG